MQDQREFSAGLSYSTAKSEQGYKLKWMQDKMNPEPPFTPGNTVQIQSQ